MRIPSASAPTEGDDGKLFDRRVKIRSGGKLIGPIVNVSRDTTLA
jgi:hypothetical protein